MVAQFKDNRFEQDFYANDKVMALSDYKKIYYIPTLESKLGYVNLNAKNPEPRIQALVNKDLAILRNEVSRELAFVNKTDFASMEKFAPGRFDSAAFRECGAFLAALKRFYGNRYNRANTAKEKLINERTSTAEKEAEFETMRFAYQNEAITELVKNTAEPNRIIEKDGRLIQKFYPIYKDPEPNSIVDFDAQFYMPAKHFLGQTFDTFFFNIGVIWSMTIILAFTLYYEVLRRVVDGLGNISNPPPKRM